MRLVARLVVSLVARLVVRWVVRLVVRLVTILVVRLVRTVESGCKWRQCMPRRAKSLTQQDFQLLALFHSKAKAKTALTRLG